MEFTLMLFQAAIACLITLSVSVLITHAIDAFKCLSENKLNPVNHL